MGLGSSMLLSSFISGGQRNCSNPPNKTNTQPLAANYTDTHEYEIIDNNRNTYIWNSFCHFESKNEKE